MCAWQSPKWVAREHACKVSIQECPWLLLQIGTLTLRKLKDLEKESGMTGSKEGGSSKKAAPKDEVIGPAPPCEALPCLASTAGCVY